MSKTSHILCIEAGHGAGQFAPKPGFHAFNGDVAEVVKGNLWIGHRPHLETLKPVPVKPTAGFIEQLLSGERTLESLFTGAGDKMDAQGGLAGLAKALGLSLDAGGDEVLAYPAYLQIIPHYLLRNRGRYLRYLRTTTGGDTRLHGRISVGVGGHVDLADVVVAEDGSIDLMATVLAGGARETREEVDHEIAADRFRWVGTLYATDEEVDSVHLGLVAVCDLADEEADALTANHEIGDMAFSTFGDLAAEVAGDPTKKLETWARLLIESNPLA